MRICKVARRGMVFYWQNHRAHNMYFSVCCMFFFNIKMWQCFKVWLFARPSAFFFLAWSPGSRYQLQWAHDWSGIPNSWNKCSWELGSPKSNKILFWLTSDCFLRSPVFQLLISVNFYERTVMPYPPILNQLLDIRCVLPKLLHFPWEAFRGPISYLHGLSEGRNWSTHRVSNWMTGWHDIW